MPTATRTAPKTATVQETIVRKEVRDPIEVPVTPPAPAPEPSGDFWKFVEMLTDDDWKTHKVVLYRYPLGQTKPDKLGRYVKTYKHGNPLVSEDQVYEEFGGSQYTALLSGPGENGRQVILAKHSWEMDGPVRNPWQQSAGAPGVVIPQNSDLAQTLQVVLQNLKAAERSNNPSSDPALKESISLIQQLTAAMPKPEGVKELVAGLASLKALTGESGGGNSLKEMLSLLKEFGIVGGERKSLASEIKEILEIAGLMNGGGEGGGGRAPRADWPTTLIQNLPTILEKVSPIADKFADAARSNARTAELAVNRRALPAPAPTRPTPAPATPAAAAVPVPAESPASRTVAAPETEPTAPAGEQPAAIVFQQPNLEWVKGKAVQMFQQGKPGDEIAEFLDNLDDQLGTFLASMDEAAFRAFVENDVILRAISGAPRYSAFVRDFVGYFSEEEEPPASDDESNADKK